MEGREDVSRGMVRRGKESKVERADKGTEEENKCKSSFKDLKLLTLENINRYMYQILLFMFCFNHNLLPSAIYHVIALGIQTNSQMHSHYARSSHHYRS